MTHDSAPAPGTALVPVGAAPAPRGTPFAAVRADAGFIAHLLAVRAGVPEHRAKRRATPERGAAAYGTSSDLGPRPMRGRLDQAV